MPTKRVGPTDLELTRRAAFRFQQRDATRRAETRRGSAGPTNGRASGAATSWPARAAATQCRTEQIVQLKSTIFVSRAVERCRRTLSTPPLRAQSDVGLPKT